MFCYFFALSSLTMTAMKQVDAFTTRVFVNVSHQLNFFICFPPRRKHCRFHRGTITASTRRSIFCQNKPLSQRERLMIVAVHSKFNMLSYFLWNSYHNKFSWVISEEKTNQPLNVSREFHHFNDVVKAHKLSLGLSSRILCCLCGREYVFYFHFLSGKVYHPIKWYHLRKKQNWPVLHSLL